ncbi:FKBP-type peptidyl-prolyl cis-trans isomerase [Actinomyces sp.]|uniref:FKBP-type peptidyl-prolyl cis-trans isomerase n=1 Tax=Actinomyces sp. TaxID=29317 RepID=UPI0026DBDE97|nr:FKBP-type peptidyl-prolyl cis-trans isomerase [Actinomyces sp.]MDO4901695.1 FKBP-type peptidyl-prolyl cis-trans isomerase [Actinomyces sp.]
MRRAVTVLPALALTACLALVGCTDSSGDASASASAEATIAPLSGVDCSTLTIDDDADSLPTVSGDAGAEPTVSWGGGDAPANLTVKTLASGDGGEVTEDSIVVANYAGWEWGATETFDSSYARGEATPFSLQGVISGWRCGLAGHRAGDRLLLSIPAELAYGQPAASPDSPSGTLVFIVEVEQVITAEEAAMASKDAVLDAAAQQTLADRGVTVSGDLGAAASIAVADGAAEPAEQETIVLARGTGDEVAEGDQVVLEVALVNWGDNDSLQSSWEVNQPQLTVVSKDTTIGGLVGTPVGSRVVILLPGDATRGTTASVYVVDVAKVI